MATPEDVLAFWLDEVGPDGWFKVDETLDQTIRDRFQDLWQTAREGGLSLWLTFPSGTLAYIVLTDQFSRNMFRGEGKAFDTDILALAAAKMAIGRNWDMRIDEPARRLFYLPLMHSESLSDQDRCVRLFVTRIQGDDGNSMLHARAHREIVRKFGRFPFRNAALGRDTRAAEQAFLDEGGYGATLRALEPA